MSTTTNPEAEAALIYSLVLDPTQILDVADLQDEDFSIAMWAQAFNMIKSKVEHNEPVDILTLRKDGVTIDAMELAGRHAPATEYARLIRDAAYRRRVVEAANQIAYAAEMDESSLIEAVESAVAVIRTRKTNGDEYGLMDLDDFGDTPAHPHLGLLSPEGTTVIYGEGGDGKGWIAAAMIKGLMERGIKVAILDFENHPSEWKERLDILRVPISEVSYFQPPVPMGKWANSRLAGVMKERNIGFFVIDSAMYATNTDDPYSPAGVMQYKQARLRLGNIPAILLAHTAKGQTSIYGSAFWRNEARITWFLSRDKANKRWLECKKTNAYPHLEGKVLSVDFDQSTGRLDFHEQGKQFQNYIQHSPVSEPEEEFTW